MSLVADGLVRRVTSRITTPLLPDDYLKLINPLWTAREVRGKVVEVRTGALEEHVTSDVAWAADHYLAWTGDEEFARGKTGGGGEGRASVGKRSERGAGGQGGGGGGGGPAQAKDAAWGSKVVTRKSSRPARKRS